MKEEAKPSCLRLTEKRMGRGEVGTLATSQNKYQSRCIILFLVCFKKSQSVIKILSKHRVVCHFAVTVVGAQTTIPDN